MALTGFAYDSERARLARLTVLLGSRGGAMLLVVAAGVLVVIGAFILMAGGGGGLIVAAIAAWPLMLYVWYKRYLTQLPANTSDTLDGRLEVSLLGRLPRNLTPQVLVTRISEVTSAQFLMVRSGISTQMLTQVLGDDPEAIALVWAAVRDMQPEGVVKASTMVAALTKRALSYCRFFRICNSMKPTCPSWQHGSRIWMK